MEIFLVMGFLVVCFFIALALYVMATRIDLPPDSELMFDKYLDDVPESVKAAWESIKLKK